MAQIASIVYQPAGNAREPNRFVRVAQDRVTLRGGHGIEGDAKAGRHPERQLNLLSAAWLAARVAEGWDTRPGAFGENMVLVGLAVEALAPGTCLQVGETALLEITKPRIQCAKLATVLGNDAVLEGPAGVFARVLAGGVVQVGDWVQCRPVAVPSLTEV